MTRRTSTDAAPETQSEDSGARRRVRREVLLVGELAKGVRTELAHRGARLTEVRELADAFSVLAVGDFHVVLLEPLVSGGATDFVNALKEGPVEYERTLITLYGPREGSTFLRGVRPPSRETLEAARRRHALTPFIIAPLENELFYAIVLRPPDATLLQEIKKVPLVSAVMSVTPSELLGKTTALA